MDQVIAPPTPQSPVNPDTLTSVTALARFEFEPGRSNDGSKVLMVEWQDDEHESRQQGSYHISWPGMRTVFPVDDQLPADNIRRVFYLIPPGHPIPPYVTLAYHHPQPQPQAPETTNVNANANVKTKPTVTAEGPEQQPAVAVTVAEPLKKTVQPLPAIFTRELGATAKVSGKKGVLHTLWAKRRLQALNAEIEAEQAKNAEGVALEMALDEKRYIEHNFGLLSTSSSTTTTTTSSTSRPVQVPSTTPLSPPLQSPKSPGGGSRRLSEKLKGLSLGTTDEDLKTGRPNTFTHDLHPLSPEVSDVAHSAFRGFGSFHQQQQKQRPASPQSETGSGAVGFGAWPGTPDPSSAQSVPPSVPPAGRRVLAQHPPESIKRQQQQQQQQQQSQTSSLIAGSINFITQQQPKQQNEHQLPNGDNDEDEDDQDLFAVAIGPRSPDIPKSPFSFSSADVGASYFVKSTTSTTATTTTTTAAAGAAGSTASSTNQVNT